VEKEEIEGDLKGELRDKKRIHALTWSFQFQQKPSGGQLLLARRPKKIEVLGQKETWTLSNDGSLFGTKKWRGGLRGRVRGHQRVEAHN